ncbi:sensor histidine kinase [Paenibacillus sp. YN15]|uniref:sensor histidine kinase n=1 Tax=Paenibacillus sp. YN15 TaxID=1742774 RepID=UPI000DCE380C|nr:sensor histidine kinase [Paenibacillus sp. YN15]RAU91923.1 two-component sensor histidine kinase [Paenibacillus sp. YN15]
MIKLKSICGGMSFKLFVLCLLFVFLVVSGVTQLSYRYMRKEMQNNNDFYVRQILSKVDQYLTLTSSSIQTQLHAINASYVPGMPLENLKPEMGQLLELNQGLVKNVYVVCPDLGIIGGSPLTVVFEDPREERRPFYEKAAAHKGEVIYTAPYESLSSGWTVTMAKYLTGSEPPAVVALDMDLSAFESMFMDLSRSDLLNMGIIDGQGMLIAGFPRRFGAIDPATRRTVIGNLSSEDIAATTESFFTAINQSGQPIEILKYPASRFDWSIISVNDDSRMMQSYRRLRSHFWLLMAGGLVLSTCASWLVTRYIRKPVHFLRNQMRAVKLGSLSAEAELQRSDEFGELSRTFNQMIRRIQDLVHDREETLETKRLMEIQVLQSQINPHFLYNTLGSISNIVGLGQYDKVDTVVFSLIRILEYGIADASRPVTLQEELDNVKDFIQVQNLRYCKSFAVMEEIEPELYAYPVFRMFLQPIVENSLFHGYCGGRTLGSIRIRSFRESGRVVVTVEDQGIGMSAAAAERLLQDTPSCTPGRKRIGLRNIHQRIQLYYGSDYGLTVHSRLGEGTCVRAEFPASGDKDKLVKELAT